MIKESKDIIILPDRFRDPYTFESVLSINSSLLESSGTVDMSRIAFIEPYSMISFLLMGRNFLRKRGEKLKLIHIPIHIHQYLNRMDFFSKGIFILTETLPEGMSLKRNPISNRLLEITEIPGKERQGVNVLASVISLFRKRSELILKFWMDESIVDYFVTVLSELCQNIFEHSLDSGFVTMQTYKSGKENIARLVISDSGVGIRGSFEGKKTLNYKTTSQLIELALTTPISSKREFGYGLCQVNSITEKLKGTIFIRSESSSLTVLYNKIEKGKNIFHRNDLPYFEGTQIAISLSA